MKLFVFDMDGTLLQGRTILFLGREFGFYNEALEMLESDVPKYVTSQKLAGLLEGVSLDDFMEVIKKIPLTVGAEETVETLKSQGHKTAIVTDSYDIVAEHFKIKLGMDRAVGNQLIIGGGRITGRLEMPPNCSAEEECNNPAICKLWIMKAIAEEFEIPISETVAIGDNLVDLRMIEEAGLGIAFDPKVKELEEAADVVIKGNDLREVLRYTSVK
jgi:phosphoserine phosphatase